MGRGPRTAVGGADGPAGSDTPSPKSQPPIAHSEVLTVLETVYTTDTQNFVKNRHSGDNKPVLPFSFQSPVLCSELCPARLVSALAGVSRISSLSACPSRTRCVATGHGGAPCPEGSLPADELTRRLQKVLSVASTVCPCGPSSPVQRHFVAVPELLPFNWGVLFTLVSCSAADGHLGCFQCGGCWREITGHRRDVSWPSGPTQTAPRHPSL